MARELELKFKLSSQSELLERLSSFGITLSAPVEQSDTVFLPDGCCFEDLHSGVPVIRIRQSGGQTTTTLKKYVNGILDREEVECLISDSIAFTKYLRLLDYVPVVTVKKTRRMARYCEATITLDDVDRLGFFAEIEMISEENKIAKCKKQLEKIVFELGLDLSRVTNIPYDEMLFARGENDA